ALLALAVYATGLHRELSLEALVRRRGQLEAFVQAHFATALAGYIGLYIVATALSIPGAVFLTLAGAVLFGWLVGGIATLIGATAGATLLFLLARYALADLVRRRLGSRLTRLADGFRADAFSYLLFLRLVPVFPFWLVNLAPALAGARLGTFVAATALGIIPGTFAYAVFGAGLDSVLAAQEAAYRSCLAAGRADCRLDFDLRAAITPQLFAALCALGLVALVPVLVRRWRARRQPRSSAA
ncbi:MAG TPA: VTT domain-containing protein, partial [Xanthobacteraceae bacterium]